VEIWDDAVSEVLDSMTDNSKRLTKEHASRFSEGLEGNRNKPWDTTGNVSGADSSLSLLDQPVWLLLVLELQSCYETGEMAQIIYWRVNMNVIFFCHSTYYDTYSVMKLKYRVLQQFLYWGSSHELQREKAFFSASRIYLQLYSCLAIFWNSSNTLLSLYS
jgi:hypothetical protein